MLCRLIQQLKKGNIGLNFFFNFYIVSRVIVPSSYIFFVNAIRSLDYIGYIIGLFYVLTIIASFDIVGSQMTLNLTQFDTENSPTVLRNNVYLNGSILYMWSHNVLNFYILIRMGQILWATSTMRNEILFKYLPLPFSLLKSSF